jgi:hypothetical protein
VETKERKEMNDIVSLANIIYGEAADQSPEVMKMVGSSVIRRAVSGRAEEFGATIPEVIQKGYYAAKNPNIPYKQALAQQFPDKNSENKYKQALQIASGLFKGTIEPDNVMFYFTNKEINKLSKNKKAFNFQAVKKTGESGDYKTFSY